MNNNCGTKLLIVMVLALIILVGTSSEVASAIGNNVAQGKNTNANDYYSAYCADYKAFDGDIDSYWQTVVKATPDAPNWIEVDLGKNYNIAQIKLNVFHLTNGNTIHNIYTSNEIHDSSIGENVNWALVKTLSGYTIDSQFLTVDFTVPLSNVRYIKVETINSESFSGWREIEVYESSDGGTSTPSQTPTPSPMNTLISTPTNTQIPKPAPTFASVDTSLPSISISKQIVDSNKNEQLDEGEKLVITYGANDESGVKSIKVLQDGNLIELRNNEGIYSVTTDSLSIGSHSIVVEAIDSKGNKKSEEMMINAARAGPSVFFPKSRYEVIEGEDFSVVLSAVNPLGNPKMNALLILKPPGNGISTYESDCKGFSGQCSGKFEIESGDNIRSVSTRMRADKTGEYQLDAEVYYQFENGVKSPTRYETLNIVVKPKPIETAIQTPIQTSIPKTQGFEVIFAGIGIILALVLWRR